jgi:transmembrane sensor
MKQGKKEWKWMIQRFCGTISHEDDVLLSTWIEQSEDHRNIYEDAVKIWQHSTAKLRLDDAGTNQEWSKIKGRIEKESGKVIKLTVPFSSLGVYQTLGVAASILIVSLVGVFLFLKKEKAIDQIKKPTIIASANEVKTIYLPDSSKVWLNINSEISYPNDFGQQNRKVELKGEAYFAIRPDSMPFFVNTTHAIVQVLGTSFNVKDADNIATVTVAQGKVALINSSSNYKAEITQGETGVVKEKYVEEKKNTDLNFASWRKKNNPIYLQEVKNPNLYLSNKNNWKKNRINLSVIDGTLTNSATLASYKNVVLKATFTKPSGKTMVLRMTITDTVHPGQKLTYRKTLMDIFTKTQKLNIEVESAQVVSI